MKRTERFICSCCNRITEVDWENWSNEVMLLHLANGEDIRVCKLCQDGSDSFRKNCARFIVDMYNTLECDDRK